MDNKKDVKVDFIVYESTMNRLERTNKRKADKICLSFIIMSCRNTKKICQPLFANVI